MKCREMECFIYTVTSYLNRSLASYRLSWPHQKSPKFCHKHQPHPPYYKDKSVRYWSPEGEKKHINKQTNTSRPRDLRNFQSPNSGLTCFWCLTDRSSTWIQDWQNKCLLNKCLSRFNIYPSNIVHHSFRECCFPPAKVFGVSFIQQRGCNSVLKRRCSFIKQSDKI